MTCVLLLCSYPYLAVVLNFSQSWALYCLVQFYSVTKDKLAPIKPLAKFLTFKSIVFLTWWQGVAVAFLFSMGAFKGSLAQELKTRIQDYIICIEVRFVFHLVDCSSLSFMPASKHSTDGGRLFFVAAYACDMTILDCHRAVFPNAYPINTYW